MKTGLLLLLLSSAFIIIAGASEPAAVSVFGAGLLSLGKLIREYTVRRGFQDSLVQMPTY
ncbi:MAG: hypothetical protein GY795_14995 [Desulfobacterales bacterium]|nr:hypothetical protein [Desulfobacterales bacterium]